jgi:hypothetical protein
MYAVPIESTATAGADGKPDVFAPIAIGFDSADALAAKHSISMPAITLIRTGPMAGAGNLTQQLGDGKRRPRTFSERSFRVQLGRARGATDHQVGRSRARQGARQRGLWLLAGGDYDRVCLDRTFCAVAGMDDHRAGLDPLIGDAGQDLDAGRP